MQVSLIARTALLAVVFLFAPSVGAAPTVPPPQRPSTLAPAQLTPNPSGDVLDVAAASGQFTQFLAAVQAAGYEDTLRAQGPYTVFAPTDTAFREMDRHELARLMEPRNRDELRSLLAYHVLRGRMTTGTAHGAITHPEALNGYPITVDGRDGLRVNDQLVAMPDVQARNGVIQGINSVLSPPVMVASR